MARGLRIEYPDALYHIMSRGNAGQAIALDDEDRRVRLSLLQRAVTQERWIVHAFVLMTNHDHLLVQTPRANLSNGLRSLNARYASYFNRRHGRSGHLFQERPKAHLIEESGYFATASRYIHLNPWKAGLVDDPLDYPWSSYRGYVHLDQLHPFVEYASVLSEFGTHEIAARASYRAFVQSGMVGELTAPWKDAGRDGIVGSNQFERRIRTVLDHLAKDVELPRIAKTQYRPALEKVVAAVNDQFGRGDLQFGGRCDGLSRCIAAYLAREAFGYRSTEVAAALGYRNSSSVSAAVRRAKGLPPAIATAVGRLRLELLSAGARTND